MTVQRTSVTSISEFVVVWMERDTRHAGSWDLCNNIFTASSSTSFCLHLPLPHSRVLIQSLGAASRWVSWQWWWICVCLEAPRQPGRQVSPKNSWGPWETVHAVHSLVLDLWVWAHQRSWQVWVFHCYFPLVPQCAMSCSLPTCLLCIRKGQEPHKQGEKQSGAARPPRLLIPPDIRALMNVLSWSREYCGKLLPSASPAFARPWSYQGYLTWLSPERAAIAAGRLLQGASCLRSRRGERDRRGVAFLTVPLAVPFPSLPPRAAWGVIGFVLLQVFLSKDHINFVLLA